MELLGVSTVGRVQLVTLVLHIAYAMLDIPKSVLPVLDAPEGLTNPLSTTELVLYVLPIPFQVLLGQIQAVRVFHVVLTLFLLPVPLHALVTQAINKLALRVRPVLLAHLKAHQEMVLVFCAGRINTRVALR